MSDGLLCVDVTGRTKEEIREICKAKLDEWYTLLSLSGPIQRVESDGTHYYLVFRK
jgi:hypothetical protein